MNTFIESFVNTYDLLTERLNTFGSWYLTLFVYACLYKLVVEVIVKFLQKPELKKRKQALTEINAIKDHYQVEHKFTYAEETEQIRAMKKEAKEVVKKVGVNHFMIIAPVVFQLFIFLTLLVYFYQITEVERPFYLPYASAILSFFTNLTRKNWRLNLVLAVFVGYIFHDTGGAANVFYFFYCLLALIKSWFTKKPAEIVEEEVKADEFKKENDSEEK